jgi:hypothetical protein
LYEAARGAPATMVALACRSVMDVTRASTNLV